MESFHQCYLLSLCIHHISCIPINHLCKIHLLSSNHGNNFIFTTHYEFPAHYCIKPLNVKDIEHILELNIFQDALTLWTRILVTTGKLQLLQLYLPEMMLGPF